MTRRRYELTRVYFFAQLRKKKKFKFHGKNTELTAICVSVLVIMRMIKSLLVAAVTPVYHKSFHHTQLLSRACVHLRNKKLSKQC